MIYSQIHERWFRTSIEIEECLDDLQNEIKALNDIRYQIEYKD